MALRKLWSERVGSPRGLGAEHMESLFDASCSKSLAFALVDAFGGHDPKLASALKWELCDDALIYPRRFVRGSLECIFLHMDFISSVLSSQVWGADPAAMMLRWSVKRARGNKSCFLGNDEASGAVLCWGLADVQKHKTYSAFLRHEMKQHHVRGGCVSQRAHAFLGSNAAKDEGDEEETWEEVVGQGKLELAQAVASGAPLYKDFRLLNLNRYSTRHYP